MAKLIDIGMVDMLGQLIYWNMIARTHVSRLIFTNSLLVVCFLGTPVACFS